MDRRGFLAAGAAALVVPGAAVAQGDVPAMVAERLARGETVFLDFKADWCGTCRAQGQVMTRLKAANPAYTQKISFVEVDWDIYGRSDFARGMKIPRRSTLVVLKGDRELGRLVADTREASIRGLMDLALQAAG